MKLRFINSNFSNPFSHPASPLYLHNSLRLSIASASAHRHIRVVLDYYEYIQSFAKALPRCKFLPDGSPPATPDNHFELYPKNWTAILGGKNGYISP
jgi:hypothetical protein